MARPPARKASNDHGNGAAIHALPARRPAQRVRLGSSLAPALRSERRFAGDDDAARRSWRQVPARVHGLREGDNIPRTDRRDALQALSLVARHDGSSRVKGGLRIGVGLGPTRAASAQSGSTYLLPALGRSGRRWRLNGHDEPLRLRSCQPREKLKASLGLELLVSMNLSPDRLHLLVTLSFLTRFSRSEQARGAGGHERARGRWTTAVFPSNHSAP